MSSNDNGSSVKSHTLDPKLVYPKDGGHIGDVLKLRLANSISSLVMGGLSGDVWIPGASSSSKKLNIKNGALLLAKKSAAKSAPFLGGCLSILT